MTRTKIICTIGPSVNSIEKVHELIDAGMDVARLNFSHSSHEEHLKSIEYIKEARKQAGKPIAILLDTKGPEIRLGKVQAEGVAVQKGTKLWFVKETCIGNHEKISVVPGTVLDLIPVETKILIDNGYILARVVDKSEQGLLIEFENTGVILSSKGVNVPNVDLHLPALTEKDCEDLRFGCVNGIDIIAASFVRCADHVLAIKKLLAEEKKSDILVLAKIENNEGITNFDSILHVADGIMIARGDLGVEVPLSQVPRLQKMMIRKCYMIGKPSVTATQMLESMITNPRPTRAEASDVANAIYDGTSAVMLSGETAVGKYPIETVKIMKSITAEAELDFKYHDFFDQHTKLQYHDVPSAITLSTVKTAYSLGAKAIFAFTSGGSTARLLGRLRPMMPIIAFTSNEKTYNQLALNWGVIPVRCSERTDPDMMLQEASDYALKHGLVSFGDLIVVTSGAPFWVKGTTNTLRVESIGDVLVRGDTGHGKTIHANCTFVPSAESKRPYEVRDQIIIIAASDDNYIPLMREAAGIILQNDVEDRASEKHLLKSAKALDKAAIIRADGAFRTLREGQLVTLDPKKALVYKGVIR